MASPTQWTWVWVSSGSWWWIGRPGVLQSMGLQRVGLDWATELKLLQSHLTLCYPMDCNLPGSSVHGILQARILEWVAMPSSRGSFGPRDWTLVSNIYCTARGFFTTSTTFTQDERNFKVHTKFYTQVFILFLFLIAPNYKPFYVLQWANGLTVVHSWHGTLLSNKERAIGTSPVVQGLRLQAPNAGGLGSIPGQGIRSHIQHLRVHMT